MKRTALALGVAVLTAAAVLAPVHGQDAGLPLPTPGGVASSGPSAPAVRPQLWDGFPLEANAWRVSGRDASRGDFSGTMTFTRASRRYLRYERRVSFGRSGVEELERGEVAIKEGRLYLHAAPPEVLTGLRNTFEGVAGVGDRRHAVYRLADDGRRLEGRYRYDSSRVGEERLEPVASSATGDHVTLLVDGREMFPALERALRAAQRSICLQTFIYTDDSTGRWIARLLMERARAGVKVRVLVDAIGNKMGGLEGELRAGGVEVVVQHGWGEGIKNSVLGFGRSLLDGIKRLFGGKPKPRELRGVFNHDHRKIIVIDGLVGFAGGMNIGVEYERDWHDVHARVEGPAVQALEAMFFERWRAAGAKGEALPPEARVGGAPFAGTMDVDVLGSIPGVSMAIRERYLFEINAARQRVLIENAYFLDDQIISAMQAAVRRGVRTVLILPPDKNHDVPIVRDAFAAVHNDVVRSGVELYKYRDRFVHAKVASFDGRVSTVGSSNLDNMALSKLAEVNLFVNDVGFTRTLDTRVFATDLPNSERQAERKLSWWQKVKSGTLHFFRSFL